MPDDEMARLRAAVDQAKEGMKEFAGSLWAFHSQLIEEGFAPDEAFALVLTFLQETLRMGPGE